MAKYQIGDVVTCKVLVDGSRKTVQDDPNIRNLVVSEADLKIIGLPIGPRNRGGRENNYMVLVEDPSIESWRIDAQDKKDRNISAEYTGKEAWYVPPRYIRRLVSRPKKIRCKQCY